MKRSVAQSMLLGSALGMAIGIGGYTFVFAKGASYLTNDPKACANCHIMQEQFDGWTKSSHQSVAACNDCHTPAGFVGKYSTKALNGFWHSYAFTTGWFHEPIQITERNHRVTESACRKCHLRVVQTIEGPHQNREKVSCVRCHRSVGHLGKAMPIWPSPRITSARRSSSWISLKPKIPSAFMLRRRLRGFWVNPLTLRARDN